MDVVLGVTGTYTPTEDAYRVVFPRGDIKVAIDNQVLTPFLGLSSWAAVTSDPHHSSKFLLAEFALFEDEVNPIISVALDNQLEITALENRFLSESPRVLFLNVSASGTPGDLATKIRRVLEKTKTIRLTSPVPVTSRRQSTRLEKSALDARTLDSILGTHGDTSEGMYTTSIGMVGLINGILVGKQMGIATWIAFSGTNQNSVVDGQIVMTRGQIGNVLRALQKARLEITSVQRRMADQQPEFFFVSFWGKGPAVDLAWGLRQTLEVQIK